jgi:ankyrin repeat protein
MGSEISKYEITEDITKISQIYEREFFNGNFKKLKEINKEIIEKNKINLDLKDSESEKTYLIISCEKNQLDSTKLLLELGARTKMKDKNNKTALYYAGKKKTK